MLRQLRWRKDGGGWSTQAVMCLTSGPQWLGRRGGAWQDVAWRGRQGPWGGAGGRGHGWTCRWSGCAPGNPDGPRRCRVRPADRDVTVTVGRGLLVEGHHCMLWDLKVGGVAGRREEKLIAADNGRLVAIAAGDSGGFGGFGGELGCCWIDSGTRHGHAVRAEGPSFSWGSWM